MKPEGTIIRCPNCESTARRVPDRTKLRCNFCGLRFAVEEGVVGEHRVRHGSASRVSTKRIKKAPTGEKAGTIVVGRGWRWWSGLV